MNRPSKITQSELCYSYTDYHFLSIQSERMFDHSHLQMFFNSSIKTFYVQIKYYRLQTEMIEKKLDENRL